MRMFVHLVTTAVLTVLSPRVASRATSLSINDGVTSSHWAGKRVASQECPAHATGGWAW
jgi:hypothetical protein